MAEHGQPVSMEKSSNTVHWARTNAESNAMTRVRTNGSVGSAPHSMNSTATGRSSRMGSLSLPSEKGVHPLEQREVLLSCIRLLDAKRLSSLPTPLPRAQDLPDFYFSTPKYGDQVVAVSHAWRNQAHPDPTCYKTMVLSRLLSNMLSDVAGQDDAQMLLFLDFTSIPQRPFQASHKPRTDDEMAQFRNAICGMHEMYFFADRIIHLPWEDCKVTGEGTEVLVSTGDLRGATFDQFGNAVQIAGVPQSSRSLLSVLGPKVHLFDHVVAVGNETVTSIDQLESLLKHGEAQVRLCRYPFGMSNTLPADARGWVFLERFITMVKCAMMDEDTAKRVVVTPSETIYKQIMEGGARLREAAALDLKSEACGEEAGELKNVLDSFTKEMQCKQFSAASTDKRLIDSASCSVETDRDVVLGIMQDFVQHLKNHWQAEAAEQQKLGRRLKDLVEATKTFFTEWDCFSEAYEAKMAAASTAKPWSVAVTVLLPLLPAVFVLSLPLAAPDEGWAAQSLFWSLALPLIATLSCLSFLTTLVSMTGVMYTRRLVSGIIVYLCCYCVLTVATCIGVASFFNIFPVPMVHYLATMVATPLMPGLFLCIPPDLRANRDFWMRCIYSMTGVMTVTGVFGGFFPSLNTLIPHVNQGLQALLVSGYLLAKLIFEVFGWKLSKRLGADAMPTFLCWATMCYQFNLCMVFTKADSWLIVAEQLLFDVLENWYHLWSLGRQKGRRQENYIVTSLMLREFLEVLAPTFFLIIYVLCEENQSKNMEFLCLRDKENGRWTKTYLLVGIAVELAFSCLTVLWLVRCGHEPVRLFRGLLSTSFITLLSIVTSVVLYYTFMSHSHWGMDMTFGWPWVQERDAEWLCGLTWAAAE